MKRLSRQFATGFAFFTFGFLGVFYQFMLFPGIILFVRDLDKRHKLARHIIHRTFLFFVHFGRCIGIWTWETKNIEKLRTPGQLILANHLTLVDVVFLFAFTPNASAVVKAALTKNPFTGGALKAAGYVINNDESNELIDHCVAELHKGASLIIFPEGTRTPPGQRPKLKRGAMSVALKSHTSPLMVHIDCTPLSLTKNTPWWDVPEKAMHFKFNVLGTLPIDAYLEQYQTHAPLATRAMSRDVFSILFPQLRETSEVPPKLSR